MNYFFKTYEELILYIFSHQFQIATRMSFSAMLISNCNIIEDSFPVV